MNTQNFLTMEWAFGILTSFLIALLWHFIRVLDKKFDDNESACERLRDELNAVKLAYATKAEATANMQNVMNALNRLENKLDKVNDKLDKKADKT
ncbi:MULTISPECIES: hypothetical protein [Kingella]|uniref:hypothetical protein n=1 Tax=Kingella TaxID=32257 RepID=UPI00041D658A|nr:MULTISPECIES: hypothetical protein [Kingella]MDK4527211.1 hypothetical protein [Kingella kingae]MDK4533248.1 hypothetical protein [Kingella kingae]MDK4596898.1 hypothetical protein [Kingella kingae]MDK4600864.1 hypothetical protein [Kingella kingae]MDK4624185.1 hypothetical protein [Kingella kingae]